MSSLKSFFTSSLLLSHFSSFFPSNTPSDPSIRYMPLGDSITEIVCWRSFLWSSLEASNLPKIDFVGSLTTQWAGGCPNQHVYPRHHEGHSGFRAVDIAREKMVKTWLRENPADLVSVHLGTNDLRTGVSADDIIKALGEIVADIRAANEDTKILIAQIIPYLQPPPAEQVNFNLLNDVMPRWASALNSTKSPIYVVDQYTGFDPVADLNDGLHPGLSGDRKMAARWLDGFKWALNNGSGR